MARNQGPKTIQSVDRALQILFSFNTERPRWSVTDLATSLGVHVSTASRIAGTMKEMGVLRKNTMTGEYELGSRVLDLAHTYLSQQDLIASALPHMTRLTARFNESTFLAILEGNCTVTIAQVAAPRLIASSSYHVGMRYQLSASSIGKLFLACGPQSQMDSLIADGFVPYTKHTVTSTDKLSAQLDEIRQQGFAIQNQELEIGLFAIGAPIWNHRKEMVAGVSMSGPPERLSGERLPEYIAGVCDTAETISSALGWPGPHRSRSVKSSPETEIVR